MCRFVKWMDEEWPAKFQEVACTLWDVVAKFKKTADDAQADLLGAIQLRNEIYEEKEALLSEKEVWAKERAFLVSQKEALQREATMRARFAHVSCSTLQDRIAREVQDKKMMFVVIVCMLGVLVSILFGIVLKKQVARALQISILVMG